MNRRGSIEISLTTLLEVFVIGVITILAVMIGFKVYNVFFGANQDAANTYDLMADNLQGLLKNQEPNKHIDFRFTYPLKIEDVDERVGLTGQYNVAGVRSITGRDLFKGTIFAIGTDGVVSRPFPAWVLADTMTNHQLNPAALNPPIEPAKVSKKCAKSACICFSKDIIPEGASDTVLSSILTSPEECRSLEDPENRTITFDFTQPVFTTDWDKDIVTSDDHQSYPSVLIQKETIGETVNVKIHLWSQKATLDRY